MGGTVRFRFLHAADLHLDTPFAGVRRVEPDVASTLADASLRAFDALVRLAVEREVAFVLLAGGLYDGPVRGIRAQTALRAGLERLSRAGIASFVVLGDRDPVAAQWSAVRAWPHGVTVFGADRISTVTVLRGGEPIATVHGLSHARPGATPDLVPRFRRTGGPGLHVGLLHAHLDGPPGSGASPCTLEELRATGLDYWALGHRHVARITRPDREGRPWVAEPGTPQGRGPAAQERGPKGAVLVEVEGTTVLGAQVVALDHVRIDAVQVDIGGLTDLAQVVRALGEAGRERLADAGGRPVVLSATLVGAGPVADQLHAPDATRALLERLREGSEQQQLGDGDGHPAPLWWERIHDATRRDRDLAALRQRADLPSELLAAADRLAADPDALAAFAAPHLAPLADLPGQAPGPPEQELGGRATIRWTDPDPAGWPAVVDLALDLLVDRR